MQPCLAAEAQTLAASAAIAAGRNGLELVRSLIAQRQRAHATALKAVALAPWLHAAEKTAAMARCEAEAQAAAAAAEQRIAAHAAEAQMAAERERGLEQALAAALAEAAAERAEVRTCCMQCTVESVVTYSSC